MFPEDDGKGVIDKPYDNIRESVLGIRICRLLFAEIDKHTLELIRLKEVLYKLHLWVVKGRFLVHPVDNIEQYTLDYLKA
jgi:hypothetical protein